MKASWTNVLENSTVTVTSAATGYDDYRLYDRRFGLMWKATSTATQTIHVDRGAGSLDPIDTLIVPSGHNMAGCGMTFERSANNSTWTPIVTGWTEPAGALEILKQGASTNTDRYLRMVISGASVAPQAAECWMGLLYSFVAEMKQDANTSRNPVSVSISSLYSKTRHSLLLGSAKYRVRGSVVSISAAERSIFEDWLSTIPKPFYFVDPDSNGYFAEFYNAAESPPEFQRGAAGISALNPFEIEQVF